MDSSNKAFGSCYINGAYRYLYSTDLIEANTKYNAVLTYDGSVLKFYLNGVLQDSYASTKGITSPSNSTIYVMGANPYGSTAKSHYLKGNIYKLKKRERKI